MNPFQCTNEEALNAYKQSIEKPKPLTCLCCEKKAEIKDYRTRYGITDGYPVCQKHFNVSDVSFWRAVRRKEEKKSCAE